MAEATAEHGKPGRGPAPHGATERRVRELLNARGPLSLTEHYRAPRHIVPKDRLLHAVALLEARGAVTVRKVRRVPTARFATVGAAATEPGSVAAEQHDRRGAPPVRAGRYHCRPVRTTPEGPAP